jgi:transposase-like protein
MNIIQRCHTFVDKLRALARRSAWEWRMCPRCGSTYTIKNGGYWRHPWTLSGRQSVRIQRHKCSACGRTYSEEQAWLVRGSWYARAVHRQAVDWWVHGRSSLRRITEMLRSGMGRQERWQSWHVWEEALSGQERCGLGASTLHRWLDRAGQQAEAQGAGQLAGVACSGQMGSDGLWTQLRGGAKRVVLSLVDTVSGVVWGIVVAAEEESQAGWHKLFEQAKRVGLVSEALNGLVSDGAQGLRSYLREALAWVHHQRCVWHFWRNLAADLARAVAKGVEGLAADVARHNAPVVRKELTSLLHAVLDAERPETAEQALAQLSVHRLGQVLAQKVNEQLDRLLYHRLACHAGLARVGPEWLWRDFRLRLSRGRNHGSSQRLERAALLWMVYHNLTPAQRRSEHKRHYKHPGQSPLEAAGSSPGECTYLDALAI